MSWGILAAGFTEKQIDLLNHLDCRLTTVRVVCQFFILEAKRLNLPIAEAENQAAAGGSLIVRDRRRIAAAAKTAKEVIRKKQQFAQSKDTERSGREGPESSLVSYPRYDNTSFAFSLCLDPHLARLFIHWAHEASATAFTYQMSHVRNYDFNRIDDLTDLHNHIDNIFDWGLGSRKRKIVEDLDMIEAAQPKVAEMPKTPTANKKRKTAGGGVIHI